MRLRNILIATGITMAAIGAGAFSPRWDPSYPDVPSLAELPPTGTAIEIFERRVALNPNPIDLALLGEFHARSSRETGDLSSLERAEEVFLRAVDLAPKYGPAVAGLAAVYLTQHRFDLALATAQEAQELNPRLGALALAGDVLIATGEYEQAAAAYAEVGSVTPSPGLSARLAHLDELHGHLEAAITTMERATAADLRTAGRGEAAAWYQVRLGDLNFTIGKLGEANRRYQASLEVFPGYYAGLAGLARVAAARGDYDAAIDLYEQAIAVIPRPELLAAVGDLYTLTGRIELASDRYATVEAIARLGGGVYDRTLAIFYADHGRPGEALALAELGLETRHDIFAHDTRAWALYRLGRFAEAREAIDQALVLGTRDSALLFHAGSISLALGERERAITELTAALDLNRHFHPIFAPASEAMLEDAAA